jgi:uncharacterized protein (TIGR04255 family)
VYRCREERRKDIFIGDTLYIQTCEEGRMTQGTPIVARPADLPDYEDPPVNEVVIGIQFEPTTLTGAHVGLFWEELRGEFPQTSEQPPLEPKIEAFEGSRFSAPTFQFASWRASRHWLISADEVHLIQIQADRLFYNWRRGPHNAPYPHFEAIQERFWNIAEKWSAFLKKEEQILRLTQWEVTYINHILTPGGKPTLADVLSCWSEQIDRALGGSVNGGRLEAQKVLTADTSPWARMYVNITTAIRSDQAPLIAFELTVRGTPEGEDMWETTRGRLFEGRRRIVTAFDTLTTPKMHAIWGRK